MPTLSQLRQILSQKLGNHGSDLVKNALLAGGTRAFGVLLGFALLWIVGQRFGEAGAGYFTVPQSILIILRIAVSMGLGLALVRLIAQLPEGEWWSRYLAALRGALPLAFVIGLVVALGSPWIAGVILGNPDLRWPVAAAGVALPFFTLTQLNAEVARGLKRMVDSEMFRGVGLPLIALLLFLLVLGASPAGAFYSFAVACVVVALVSTVMMVRQLRRQRTESRIRVQQLLELSLPMMVGEFGVILLGRIDHLMLEMLGSTEDAGVYGVVLRLSAIVLFVPGAVGAIAAPKIAGLFGNGDTASFRKVALLVAQLMFWAALVPTIILGAAPGFWMGLFGAGFERGGWALVGLALAGLLVASTGFIGSILNMTGGERFYRNIILIALAANIVLNAILIPIINLNGAALASLITVVFWNTAGVIYIRHRHGFWLIHVPGWRRRTDAS